MQKRMKNNIYQEWYLIWPLNSVKNSSKECKLISILTKIIILVAVLDERNQIFKTKDKENIRLSAEEFINLIINFRTIRKNLKND